MLRRCGLRLQASRRKGMAMRLKASGSSSWGVWPESSTAPQDARWGGAAHLRAVLGRACASWRPCTISVGTVISPRSSSVRSVAFERAASTAAALEALSAMGGSRRVSSAGGGWRKKPLIIGSRWRHSILPQRWRSARAGAVGGSAVKAPVATSRSRETRLWMAQHQMLRHHAAHGAADKHDAAKPLALSTALRPHRPAPPCRRARARPPMRRTPAGRRPVHARPALG